VGVLKISGASETSESSESSLLFSEARLFVRRAGGVGDGSLGFSGLRYRLFVPLVGPLVRETGSGLGDREGALKLFV
jgi:hypothetical protein